MWTYDLKFYSLLFQKLFPNIEYLIHSVFTLNVKIVELIYQLFCLGMCVQYGVDEKLKLMNQSKEGGLKFNKRQRV